MKRIALLVSFLAAFSFSYPADLVTQNIGLVLDPSSPNRNIELILKKVILSVEDRNQNVRITSADKVDLDFSGIQELNGNVMLRAAKKSGYYLIELFQVERGATLIDDSTRMYLKDFGNTVESVALKLVGIIAKKFPPKPAQELTKIDVRKIKLSEYESQLGYWSLLVQPGFNILRLSATILDSALSGSDGNDRSKNFINNGGSVSVEGFYRVQQWNFAVSGAAGFGGWSGDGFHASFNDFYASGLVGYGIFGSLIILGIEPTFHFGSYRTDAVYFDGTNNLVVPDMTFQNVQIGMYFQINISKDYNFCFSGSFPIPADFFTEIQLDFIKTGRQDNSGYINVRVPSQYISGMPLLKFRFNFRLFPKLWVQLYYDTIGPNFYSDSASVDVSKKPIPISTDGELFLRSLNYQKTRIGLGVQYDF